MAKKKPKMKMVRIREAQLLKLRDWVGPYMKTQAAVDYAIAEFLKSRMEGLPPPTERETRRQDKEPTT